MRRRLTLLLTLLLVAVPVMAGDELTKDDVDIVVDYQVSSQGGTWVQPLTVETYVHKQGGTEGRPIYLTELDSNGDPTDQKLLGTIIGQSGCVTNHFTYASSDSDNCFGDCLAPRSCYIYAICETTGFKTYGPAQGTMCLNWQTNPPTSPSTYFCTCMYPGLICAEDSGSVSEEVIGGWSPDVGSDFFFFNACDENNPITTAGGCGEEDESPCYPLCGGSLP